MGISVLMHHGPCQAAGSASERKMRRLPREEVKAEEKKKRDAKLAEEQDATGQTKQEMEVYQESASNRRVTMRRNIATPRRE